MEFKAEQRYLIVSPRKIRPVADLARKLTPVRAIDVLPFSGKRAAEPLVKVIKSAIAQAKAKGVSENDLIFKEIQIGEGPRLKRGTPVSRGQWHPIKKRMSHIRVVLTTRNDKVPSPKSQTSSKIQNKKVKTRKTKNV